MSRFYLPFFLILFFLLCPEISAGQSAELARLQSVTVEIDKLDRSERELGMNEALLSEHALALLRSKVPLLKVNQPSAEGTLLVDATLGIVKKDGKTIRYYGVLEVEAFRLVAIQKNEQLIWAPVWDGQYILTGRPEQAVDQVKDTLGLIITEFAAKWHQDNP